MRKLENLVMAEKFKGKKKAAGGQEKMISSDWPIYMEKEKHLNWSNTWGITWGRSVIAPVLSGTVWQGK